MHIYRHKCAHRHRQARLHILASNPPHKPPRILQLLFPSPAGGAWTQTSVSDHASACWTQSRLSTMEDIFTKDWEPFVVQFAAAATLWWIWKHPCPSVLHLVHATISYFHLIIRLYNIKHIISIKSIQRATRIYPSRCFYLHPRQLQWPEANSAWPKSRRKVAVIARRA